MLSDILGLEIKTPAITIGASYGDALMAMIGTGNIESFEEASKLIKIGDTYKPVKENNEKYLKYYDIYDSLYNVNRDLMHKLDELNR